VSLSPSMVIVTGVGDFERTVLKILRNLPPGQVVTYGEVAEEAGFPGAARAVGNLLARSNGLPWWRVITSTGRLVPGHERAQARRLRAEGVRVRNGRVQSINLRRSNPSRAPRAGRRYT
jgi:methylated-DNA-protein-cysteine methyltransferase related protein